MAPEHGRRWHEFLEFWEASELKKCHRAGKDDADYLVEFERKQQSEAPGSNVCAHLRMVPKGKGQDKSQMVTRVKEKGNSGSRRIGRS